MVNAYFRAACIVDSEDVGGFRTQPCCPIRPVTNLDEQDKEYLTQYNFQQAINNGIFMAIIYPIFERVTYGFMGFLSIFCVGEILAR